MQALSLLSGVLLLSPFHTSAPSSRLDPTRLEAVHAQRIEWMKKRAGGPPLGVYDDYRAVFSPAQASRADLLKAAKVANVQVVFAQLSDAAANEAHAEKPGGVLFLKPPEGGPATMEIYLRPETSATDQRRLQSQLKQYPDEAFGAATDAQLDLLANWDHETAARPVTGVASSSAGTDVSTPLSVVYKNTSTHILARELSEDAIRTSLAQGHAYVAHDWLCDPTGFTFIADNFLGVFDMGDTVGTGLFAGETHLGAYVPVPAKLKLIHNGTVVAETFDSKISYTAKEEGAYRLEAWLPVPGDKSGEDRPWIFSNPIYVRGTANINIPPVQPPSSVDVLTDITYSDGVPADAGKHKLDLYLPKDRKNFPVMVFLHGGSLRTGDRSLYRALGLHFAKTGIGVAIPSYRLMPANPYPAQIEDAAAAFAWTYNHIGEYGGNIKRVYVVGHSAGALLGSILALDNTYLSKHEIPKTAIRGVVAMSGVYDVRNMAEFVFDGDKSQASPVTYRSVSDAPPFLIAYCQWDYVGLPKQARDLAASLKSSFADVQLFYVPGETHVSEIISAVEEDTPLARAILSFLQ